jgi:hypothetical protein
MNDRAPATSAVAAPVFVLLLVATWGRGGDESPSRSLLAAAARGDGPRVAALLAAGADPAARDEEGRPALVLAAASGEAGAVRALLRGGASPEETTRSGWSALHAAAEKDALEAVRALLDAGARTDPRDRVRGTPLDVAEEAGAADVACLLRARGARGSGKSVGDVVCVRPWGGDGFCGRVLARDATRHRLRVSEVIGCPSGCPPRGACSEGRPVGPGGLHAGDVLWVPTSCLTDTAVGGP